MESPNPTWSQNKLKGLNLLYLGLLPLLGLLALFYSDERWGNFMYAATVNGGYIVYTVFGFFLAGIFGVIFMRFVPLPKTVFWALVMLFDAPIQIGLANFFGSDFTMSQLIIIDLEIETIGITVAALFIMIKSRKEENSDTKVLVMLTMIFGAIFVSGYFGSVTFQWIFQLPAMQQFSYYSAMLSTVLMYFFAIGKTELDTKKYAESLFLVLAIKIGLVGVWVYTAIILFYVIFKL